MKIFIVIAEYHDQSGYDIVKVFESEGMAQLFINDIKGICDRNLVIKESYLQSND